MCVRGFCERLPTNGANWRRQASDKKRILPSSTALSSLNFNHTKAVASYLKVWDQSPVFVSTQLLALRVWGACFHREFYFLIRRLKIASGAIFGPKIPIIFGKHFNSYHTPTLWGSTCKMLVTLVLRACSCSEYFAWRWILLPMSLDKQDSDSL